MGATTVSLSCSCGTLRGKAEGVDPARGNRLVCMCDDCQAYAHWLGRAEALLDAHGGTEIFQLTPAQLRLTDGVDELACMRLSPKGLTRWYAGCCRTPVANTLSSPRMPFVGVMRVFMDHEADGRTAEEALGPVLAAVNGRFARGGLPPNGHRRAPLGLLLRSARQLARGFWDGGHRPSPFFDDAGAMTAEPTVLEPAEREALRQHCGPS